MFLFTRVESDLLPQLKRGIKFKMPIIRVRSFMPLKDMRIIGAHFNEPNKLFLISIS